MSPVSPVSMFAAGSGISFGRNQNNAPQIDLGSGTIQVAAGKIGLGGFCRGIVREDINLVRNSYQFYAPLNAGGWENGIVPDARRSRTPGEPKGAPATRPAPPPG